VGGINMEEYIEEELMFEEASEFSEKIEV